MNVGSSNSGISQAEGDARYPQTSAMKAIRTGTITTQVIDGVTKAVVFATAMPSTDYEVFFQQLGNLAVGTWVTSKATGGFTLNVTIAVAGSFSYLVVQN